MLILPYFSPHFEGKKLKYLYDQFHLDEPWDSEHNKRLIAKMPLSYKSTWSKVSSQGKTNFLTVRGKGTVFPGEKSVRAEEITDSISYTIIMIEVFDENAVIWTKPDDFKYDEQNPLKGLVGLHPGGFLAGFVDGHVQFVKSSIDPKILKALFTRNGGESVDPDKF